ncbi:MAG: hypothetical protein J6Y16_11985 [Treponema sp.]|nr:hypothetical protein [Treponema sp.]
MLVSYYQLERHELREVTAYVEHVVQCPLAALGKKLHGRADIPCVDVCARLASYLPALTLSLLPGAVVGVSDCASSDLLDRSEKEVGEEAQSLVAPRIDVSSLATFRQREHGTAFHPADIPLDSRNGYVELPGNLLVGLCL